MTDRQKSIFITGAASGIGRATAELFARKGWRVGLNDLAAAPLAGLQAAIGGSASIHAADVTDSAALAAAVADFSGAALGLDVMFNCAGILDMRPFLETPPARFAQVLNVNVMGVVNGVHAAAACLKRNSDTRIISMSSVAAIYGVPEEAAYSASKFAVRGLTEALNIELEAQNIWVSDVMVAYVATPMVTDAPVKAKSVGILGVNVTPEQVAETVWQAARQRQVHWFVTEADAGVAASVDQTPWEERRAIMKSISGFA